MSSSSSSSSSSSQLSLLESINYWTSKQPNKQALSFLDDDGEMVVSLTYKDVFEKSIQLANHLKFVAKINEGERVVLVYPPSLDFIIAFLGCLYAGIIAVPTFPPDPSRLNKDLQMFTTIVKSCGAKVALTSKMYNFASKIGSLKSVLTGSGMDAWPDLDWIVTDNITVGGMGNSKKRNNGTIVEAYQRRYNCISPIYIWFNIRTKGGHYHSW